MFLLGKKIKPLKIEHSLEINSNPDEEETNGLLAQLKAGNKYVIDRIVSQYLKLAICIAGQYASKFPSKAQDLFSEAIITIYNCCYTPEKIDTGYVISKIHSHLSKYIAEDTTIRIPQSSWFRAKKQGKEITLPLKPETYKQSHIIELWDSINVAIRNNTEKQIVQLRSQYYKDEEISEIIGICRSEVTEIRNNIYKRFKKCYELT